MGIKVLQHSNPTTLQPTSKDVVAKVFQATRSDTTNTLKCVLPADATILHLYRHAGTASDAGTTAAVTVTVANNSGTVSSASDNVKTNGAAFTSLSMSSLPNIEPVPLTGDLTISVQYAETGTASTTGGPWTYVVLYVR